MNASEKHGKENYLGDIRSSIFENIEKSQSPDRLWAMVAQHLEKYDVHTLSYYHLPPIGAHDIDVPFLKRLGKKDALSELSKTIFFDLQRSFIYRCRSLNQHISFKAFLNTSELTPEQHSLFKHVHGTESLQGFIIPCHGAHGRAGFLLIETLKPEDTYDDDTLRFISLIAREAHRAYSVMRLSQTRPIKKLTAREKQILTWVAHGKSNSVIADIIGISQHTVNGYLRSIYLKTGTSDRTTAVLCGIGDGLIDV